MKEEFVKPIGRLAKTIVIEGTKVVALSTGTGVLTTIVKKGVPGLKEISINDIIYRVNKGGN